MAEETIIIVIEAPSGEKFEAAIPCGTKLSKIAADFYEAQGWSIQDPDGRRQRLVVELVNPGNEEETKRLNGDSDICQAGLQDGNTLRIFTEAIAAGPDTISFATNQQLVQLIQKLEDELAAQRQLFSDRIEAIEKRLGDTAASLATLTTTLQQQPAGSRLNDVEQTLTTLSTAFATLSQSLQGQAITFHSLPAEATPQQLYAILTASFNEPELKDLCFALAIPYDNLPGDTLSDKARELISYARRHGRLAELTTSLRQLRPRANWQGKAP